MPASDRFVPLHVWLQPAPPEQALCFEDIPDAGPAVKAAAEVCEPGEFSVMLRDIRVFRARLADALDVTAAALIRELAYAVLGRELQLAPADVTALAERILAEHPAASPVHIRHAPTESIGLDVPCVPDAELAPGDIVIAFTEGCVDARLGARIEAVLEAWQ